MKKLLSLIDAKLLRFLIVGVINTLVGMAIMFGLYNLELLGLVCGELYSHEHPEFLPQ